MKISPFIPTVYSDGLGRVTSPPFDMLSKSDEEELSKNPKNIINLKRCRDPEEARLLFAEWNDNGTLTRCSTESFVVLKQNFEIDGRRMERFGVIGIINMECEENNLIPHEETISSLVTERSKLIERMEYQTEPMFVVSDDDDLIYTLEGIMSKQKCDRHYEEPPGVINSICIVSEPDNLERIKNSLKGSVGIIADGHHRMKAMRNLSEKYEKKVPFFNNIFVYVTSLNRESVLISPVHRVIKMNGTTVQTVKNSFDLIETENNVNNDFATLHMNGKKYIMKSKQEIDYFKYLTMVDSCISRIHRKGSIFYSADLNEVLKKLDNIPDAIGITMPPWKKSEFANIVKNGKILPAKSTYFYPKIPSGIAFYG